MLQTQKIYVYQQPARRKRETDQGNHSALTNLVALLPF